MVEREYALLGKRDEKLHIVFKMREVLGMGLDYERR